MGIAAMDNTEVAGRTIQMNIARPKGEKPAPGTGGKRQQAPEGCKLFVHGITQETNNYDLKSAFEEHGSVTDAYNPGKGFAFVTFPSQAKLKQRWRLSTILKFADVKSLLVLQKLKEVILLDVEVVEEDAEVELVVEGDRKLRELSFLFTM